jgi:hypothetical protein
MRTVFQCEMCACWTRNGKWIGSSRKYRPFLCHHCEREAETNWFVRRQVETLERTKRLVDLGAKVFWAKRRKGIRGVETSEE